MRRGPGRRRYPLLAAALGVLLLAGAGVALLTSKPSLDAGSSALADVGMPLGGGTIESVSVVTGPHSTPVPVQLRGEQIWPKRLVAADQQLSVQVVVRRPGWISWLTGKTQRAQTTLTTPVAHLDQRYLTLSPGAPLRLQFRQPVATLSYGQNAPLRRRVLPTPRSTVTLPRTAPAGSIMVAAAPRAWEISNATVVSWFPAGAAAAAVAAPAPGSQLGPSTPITLTFSKPVSEALGSSMPPVLPITPGKWHQTSSHTIVFAPQGYGYGLGAHVTIGLPNRVSLVGGQGSTGSWTVPSGSTTRLQQVLAQLGYLPLGFNYSGAGVPLSPQAQEAAAITPPRGSFSWRYGNVPGALRGFWQPGASGEVTKGAVMAFENDHGMDPDGVADGAVWKALIGAVIAGHRSSFGYTFVSVNEGSPESINVWHNGKTVVTGPVNTGIPEAPTAQGLFAVFEHALSVTMSGTNPDGSHYDDPGVPYVSYFNGGDALHGFERASYGSAQSLGCVEMPYSEAAAVYRYTPVGTLVNVS